MEIAQGTSDGEHAALHERGEWNWDDADPHLGVRSWIGFLCQGLAWLPLGEHGVGQETAHVCRQTNGLRPCGDPGTHSLVKPDRSEVPGWQNHLVSRPEIL